MPLQLLEAPSLHTSKTKPMLLQQLRLIQLQDIQVVAEELFLIS